MNVIILNPNAVIGRALQRTLEKSGAAVDVVTRPDVFQARLEESPRLDVVFVGDSTDVPPPDDFKIVGRVGDCRAFAHRRLLRMDVRRLLCYR